MISVGEFLKCWLVINAGGMYICVIDKNSTIEMRYFFIQYFIVFHTDGI